MNRDLTRYWLERAESEVKLFVKMERTHCVEDRIHQLANRHCDDNIGGSHVSNPHSEENRIINRLSDRELATYTDVKNHICHAMQQVGSQTQEVVMHCYGIHNHIDLPSDRKRSDNVVATELGKTKSEVKRHRLLFLNTIIKTIQTHT